MTNFIPLWILTWLKTSVHCFPNKSKKMQPKILYNPKELELCYCYHVLYSQSKTYIFKREGHPLRIHLMKEFVLLIKSLLCDDDIPLHFKLPRCCSNPMCSPHVVAWALPKLACTSHEIGNLMLCVTLTSFTTCQAMFK